MHHKNHKQTFPHSLYRLFKWFAKGNVILLTHLLVDIRRYIQIQMYCCFIVNLYFFSFGLSVVLFQTREQRFRNGGKNMAKCDSNRWRKTTIYASRVEQKMNSWRRAMKQQWLSAIAASHWGLARGGGWMSIRWWEAGISLSLSLSLFFSAYRVCERSMSNFFFFQRSQVKHVQVTQNLFITFSMKPAQISHVLVNEL